jgi:enoyl-CoA hydratase/carnithine racemase
LLRSIGEALEVVRADYSLQVVITRANGPVWSAGLDLNDLKSTHVGRLPDWDQSTPSTRIYELVRTFPRIMIAQVHGYVLGGALALLTSHDIAIAASDTQIGMPEILRGSYGQNVTAALFHANIPIKKLTLLQLSGRNLTGDEAERIGIVSMSVPRDDLEATTVQLASEISTRSPAALAHSKIAIHVGRELPIERALQIDRLATARMLTDTDPFSELDSYLDSQKGGTNTAYAKDTNDRGDVRGRPAG